jgi:hypothetical protein
MDELVRGLEEMRVRMVSAASEDPAFDLMCIAAKQKAVASAAIQMLDEVDMMRRDLIGRVVGVLPAPPTPLHVESETYREDDRLGQVAEWMVARDIGRGRE